MFNKDLFLLTEIAINLSILDFKFFYYYLANKLLKAINLSILDFKSHLVTFKTLLISYKSIHTGF